MKEQKSLVPRRRFKEFHNTNVWEQRELSELAKFTKGSGYTKGDLKDFGSPIILYGRLYTDYETLIEDINAFVDRKENSVISLGGEVIVPSSGESAEDIARASVVGKPGIIIGGDLNIIKPNEQIDPVFLALAISNGAPNKDMAKRAQGKSVVHLHNSDLQRINLVFPQIEEQKKIAEFNLQLDNLITLHQRKLEKTKALKSACLSEMFPIEGEREPKRRFMGFTGSWEQRKLGEISDFITKGATPTTYGFNWVEKGIPFFRNDSIKDNKFVFGEYSYISEEANATLIRSEIHCNDILIAITGDIGKVGIVPKSIDKANINQHMAKIRILKDAYPYFMYQYLSIDEMQKKYQKIKTGLSMPQLSLEQIRDTIVKLPSIEEQKQIGSFFAEIDNLITLHQRKLEKLQSIKKAYLNEMFV
jgi:type I restriction enzyme S subunit